MFTKKILIDLDGILNEYKKVKSYNDSLFILSFLMQINNFYSIIQ